MDGSYSGRVLTEIARHRQTTLQRVRSGIFPQSVSPSAAQDVGNVAVIPDDGTLINTANSFDLDQKQLVFHPSGGDPSGAGYRVQAGAGGFDSSAAGQGILLNPPPATNPENIGDDGTRQIALPFVFPFFGTSYDSVFINSDGNVTFGAGDAASTARSLGRMLAGPPRISPFFDDLDATAGGQLTYLSTAARFVVTWNHVPDWSDAGIGPIETFQVVLTPDGTIQFSYSGIHGPNSVVGISPGNTTEAPAATDLSTTTGQFVTGPIAEVFTLTTTLDLVAVAQRFYQTHEDAYQYLMIFTTFDFDLNGAFAYEVNIANQATGIGNIGDPPTFDYADQFGSARLESMLNMGNLSRYPANPSTVFLRGVDSTLSVMGQESGHRFLAYASYFDPDTGTNSTGLLGRDLQHWSFFFNSDASVMEGNRIRDNGNGTFTTIGAVQHYNEIDQYIMGLRPPESVGPTFLVKNPNVPISPAAAPALNVTFAGQCANITIDQIVKANGPRLPNSVISRKRYNYAFVLVVPRGVTPAASDTSHVDTIRSAWEPFYDQATSFLGTAHTSLVRSLQFQPTSIGLVNSMPQMVTVKLAGNASSDVAVQLSNSNPAAVSVPSQVVIPAGSRAASFPITALSPGASAIDGRAFIDASAAGFETATLVAQVAANSILSLAVSGGNDQIAMPGTTPPQPLSVSLSDANQIGYAGAQVTFSVLSGDAILGSPTATTDAQGTASTQLQFGPTTGPVKVRASVANTPLFVDFSLISIAAPQVSPAGIVNGASFAPPLDATFPKVSPGEIISIFGTNLAAAPVSAQTIPLQTSLGGTSVTIGSVSMPLLYVSPLQINVQVPTELVTGFLNILPTMPLTVHNPVGDSLSVSALISPVAPGIFAVDSSGSGAGAILHNSTGLPVNTQNPAVPGEFVQIFATGLGSVSPPVPSGQAVPAQSSSQTTIPVTVIMNGVSASVSFSGLAPGFVGLYQVNAQVPQIASSTAQVVLTMNSDSFLAGSGRVSSPPVTMAVGSR